MLSNVSLHNTRNSSFRLRLWFSDDGFDLLTSPFSFCFPLCDEECWEGTVTHLLNTLPWPKRRWEVWPAGSRRRPGSGWSALESVTLNKQSIDQSIHLHHDGSTKPPPPPTRIWNEPDVNFSAARGEGYTLRFNSSLKYCLFIWACFVLGFFFGFLTVKNLVVNRLSHISVQRGSGEERKSIKSNTAFIYFYSP